MQTFLRTLLECSVAMSVISLAYMALMPLLSRRYTAKWRYYVWLVIVIGWILPFRPHLDAALLPVKMPAIQVMPVEHMSRGEPLMIVANETSSAAPTTLWWAIAGVWFIGVIGIIAYHAWRHWRFVKMASRWSEDVTNSQTLGVLHALKAEMNVATHVGLKTCPGITSPMLIGFLRPVVLLPSAKIASDELALILRHELVHLKRNDLWYKALVLLATAVHWFNPVVYIMAKAIAAQCEISCDELVLQGTSFQQRKQYGETIIGVVRNGAKLQTALSTNFYGGKKGMKTRIFSIMDTTKKKAGITILGVALLAIIGTGMVFAANAPNVANDVQAEPEFIGPTESKQVINVDVKSLESGEFVCLGQYTLEEGDIITYNITAKGNGNLNVEFRKTADPRDGKGYLGHSGFAGNSINFSSFKVKNSLAGTYYLWIGNYDGEALNNIKGTVEIALAIATE